MQKLFLPMALLALLLPSGVQGDSHFRGTHRLLLVFAPNSSDPRWQRQEKLLSQSQGAFVDRDLLRFDVFQTPAASSLRARYHVQPGQFRVLLIGKDGHVASAASTPVSLNDLTGQIDRMPMRREEMRRKGER